MKTKSTASIATAKDGTNIHYWHTYKPGMNKSTIVLHPGAGMNHSSFEPFEKGLNDRGHPTVLIEQRGLGYSQTPKSPEYLTLERFSGDLQNIVEKLGLEKPEFVGHSFAGMILADYVARTQNANKVTGFNVSDNFRKTTFPLAINGFGIFGYAEYLGSLLTGFWHNEVKGVKRPYNDQSNLEGKSDLAVWLSITDVPFKEIDTPLLNESLSHWNVTEQLGKVKVPIHLIHGNQDFMVWPSKAQERIRRYAGGLVTSDTLPGTHTLPYVNPQAVLQLMDKYE